MLDNFTWGEICEGTSDYRFVYRCKYTNIIYYMRIEMKVTDYAVYSRWKGQILCLSEVLDLIRLWIDAGFRLSRGWTLGTRNRFRCQRSIWMSEKIVMLDAG